MMKKTLIAGTALAALAASTYAFAQTQTPPGNAPTAPTFTKEDRQAFVDARIAGMKAALKLTPTGNTIGRFFPTRCQHEIHDDRKAMTLHFGGTGFAWTPVAGRVGFSVETSIEYKFDFFMSDDDIYVWAKQPQILRGPDFQVGSVENTVVNWGLKSPAGWMVDQFGSQIVSSQLASGFTVLHGDDGDDFTLGILQPGQTLSAHEVPPDVENTNQQPVYED